MRVRITDSKGIQKTFPSLQLAMKELGVSRKKLQKEYSVVRFYEEGYWRSLTDTDWLTVVKSRNTLGKYAFQDD